jgi:hypothetical protein
VRAPADAARPTGLGPFGAPLGGGVPSTVRPTLSTDSRQPECRSLLRATCMCRTAILNQRYQAYYVQMHWQGTEVIGTIVSDCRTTVARANLRNSRTPSDTSIVTRHQPADRHQVFSYWICITTAFV